MTSCEECMCHNPTFQLYEIHMHNHKLDTDLHFKKAYTHSGTSCSQCVYQICRHLIWKTNYENARVSNLPRVDGVQNSPNNSMCAPNFRSLGPTVQPVERKQTHRQTHTERRTLAKILPLPLTRKVIMEVGIRIGDRKYLNEYTLFPCALHRSILALESPDLFYSWSRPTGDVTWFPILVNQRLGSSGNAKHR